MESFIISYFTQKFVVPSSTFMCFDIFRLTDGPDGGKDVFYTYRMFEKEFF